jgi:hypothetical protein
MGSRPKTTPLLALLAAGLAGALAAAVALANVTVYKNGFSSKGQAKQLEQSTGRHCAKNWIRHTKTLKVKVTRGPEVCGYRPPVEGDRPKPDHDFRAKMKLSKDTPKSVRDTAYVAIAVRSAAGAGYELRIFPTKHKFELRRSPGGGGGAFPATGTNPDINGLNKPNTLRLKAFGSQVTAAVNGTQLAQADDSNPDEVDGRKLEISVGHTKSSGKDVVVFVDDLLLRVPTP